MRKLGIDASLGYMSVISNTDVYETAKTGGLSNREAALLTMGTTYGMFGVDKYLGLGEMFFDEPQTQKALRASIKKEDLRTRRALYGLADGVLMIIIFGIIAQLLKGIIADEGTDGISGETLRFMDNVNQKVLNESNLWGNTFGALRSEPAFWTYSTKVAGDIIDVTQGDKSMLKALSQRVRAFEFLEVDE